MKRTRKPIAPTIADIKPGVNYPESVIITEPGAPRLLIVLQSYVVGMYAAIYVNGQGPHQYGDHNNKSFVTGLVKDLKSARKRGATIEIGSIQPIQKDQTNETITSNHRAPSGVYARRSARQASRLAVARTAGGRDQ